MQGYLARVAPDIRNCRSVVAELSASCPSKLRPTILGCEIDPGSAPGAKEAIFGKGACMKKFLVGFWVAGLLVIPAATAFAHYVYNEGYVWENGSGKCLDNWGEISHGNGGGYAKSETRAVKEAFNGSIEVSCWQSWDRPPNYLRARNVLKKFNSPTGTWDVCVSGDWKYNASTNDNLIKESYYSTPCGTGTYGNNAGAFTYFDNVWKGGYMWSGSHSLPA